MSHVRDRAAVASSRQSDSPASEVPASAEEAVSVSTLTTSIQQGLATEAAREAEKMAAVSAAYHAGTYQVEASEVARAIVEDALW